MLPTRKKKSSANAGSGGSALSTADQAKKTEEDEIEQLKKELEFEQKVIMTYRSSGNKFWNRYKKYGFRLLTIFKVLWFRILYINCIYA